MKKSLLCIILVMLMLVSILPVASAAKAPITASDNCASAIVGDDDIYIFTDTTENGWLEIDTGCVATADILVVGGGGSGSSGAEDDTIKTGYGGKGGEVQIQTDVELTPGHYEVIVGAGGTSVSGTSGFRMGGIAGSRSSLLQPNSSALIEAEGGQGGASTANSGQGTSSDISLSLIHI